MKDRQTSYALRGFLGFGLGGLAIAALGFLQWPAQEAPLAVSAVVAVLTWLVGSAIAGATLADKIRGKILLSTALTFGVISTLGMLGGTWVADLLPLSAPRRPESFLDQVLCNLPSGVADGVVLGLAVGLGALYLDRYLGIQGRHQFQVWLCAFLSFAVSGSVMSVIIRPFISTVWEHPDFTGTPLTFALGGLVFGLCLDALKRRRLSEEDAVEPR